MIPHLLRRKSLGQDEMSRFDSKCRISTSDLTSRPLRDVVLIDAKISSTLGLVGLGPLVGARGLRDLCVQELDFAVNG